MTSGETLFTLRVEKATFVPDEPSIHEFVSQLRAELTQDPALKKRFDDDPRAVLDERGVAADLQRELLDASGLEGAGSGFCLFTCIITTLSCGGSAGESGGGGNTVSVIVGV